MAGGLHTQSQEPINWAEKYIERLSDDMNEIRGMEGRLTNQISDVNNRLTSQISEVNNRMNVMIDSFNQKTSNTERHVSIFALTALLGMIATLLAVCGLIYTISTH